MTCSPFTNCIRPFTANRPLIRRKMTSSENIYVDELRVNLWDGYDEVNQQMQPALYATELIARLKQLPRFTYTAADSRLQIRG